MRKLILLLTIVALPLLSLAQENCANGIDDDGDGLVDLNDVGGCSCKSNTSSNSVTSIIPNPSFEKFSQCPSQFGHFTGYVDSWTQATLATVDYFNTCSGLKVGTSLKKIVPTPLPDGNGCVGAISMQDYKEYIGVNLLQPMLAGTKYTINFSVASVFTDGELSCSSSPTFFGPINYTIYGSSYAAYSQLGTNGCPANWIALGSVSYLPSDQWTTVSITFTPPVNILAMMLGAPCTMPINYPSNIYVPSGTPSLFYSFFDNLILNKTDLFSPSSMTIDSVGSVCSNDSKLTAHPEYRNGLYQWYKDGIAIAGQTDSVLNISTLNLGAAKYSFRNLKTAGASDCSVSSKTIVNTKPTVNLAISPKTGCVPLAVTFENTTAGAGTCSWDFGDASTSTLCKTAHTYTKAGSYDVKISYTASLGCTLDSVLKNYITVNTAPAITFTADKVSGCNPLEVNFNNTSSQSTSFTWDFGDGKTANTSSVKHTYTASGKYSLKLSSTFINGCVKDITFDKYIIVEQIPSIKISSDKNTICPGESVSFTNISSGNYTCLWSFGDGTSSSNCAPVHQYTKAGKYDVTLSVKSPEGCTKDTTIVGMITVLSKPAISFSADKTTGCFPQTISFTNNTLGAVSCNWSFGNLASSSNCNTSYTFTKEGNYSVKLSVVDNFGCKADSTVNNMISLYGYPIIDLIADKTIGCEPLLVNFINKSTAYQTCVWDFGDGSTSNADNATHTYTSAGKYSVKLTATSVDGCIKDSTFNDFITVNEIPNIDFSADKNSICEGESILFANLSSGTNLCSWDFGDGTSSSTCAAVKKYSKAGKYDVTLSVKSAAGCTNDSTIKEMIEVHGKPVISFSVDKKTGCFPQTISFTNTTSNAVSCNWDYGNSSSSSNCTSTNTFTKAGNYSVKLSVTDNFGCTADSTAINMITIYDYPKISFVSDHVKGCAPLSVNFANQSTLGSTYAWDFGDATASNNKNESHVYAKKGAYDVSLKVTSTNGCESDTTISKFINVYDYPKVDFTLSNNKGCSPLNVDFSNATANAQSCLWDLGNGKISKNCSFKYNQYLTGTYDVSLTVTNTDGCFATLKKVAEVEVYEKPKADFSFTPEITNTLQTDISFSDLSTNKITQWTWNFGDGLTSLKQNPNHAFPSEQGGKYSILLEVVNDHACTDTISKTLIIHDVSYMYVPNAFTPNHDGHNDQFAVVCKNVSKYHLSIFNRWGELVFETTDPAQEWDGTMNGDPVQIDVYVYKIDWTAEGDRREKESRVGTVSLIR